MIKATLEDVCSIQSGGTPSRGTDSYWGGSIPWAKISDLEASGDGYISDTEEHISEEGLEAIRGRIFDDGTLLFAMYGSVGKAAIVRGSVSTNQAILGIKPDASRLDLSYLKFWLRSQQHKFDQDAQGVAQKNLSAGYVRSLEIPLPPLPEQQRIAAILDKADAIRRKRQQAIQLADDFLRAVFLDMFGDPVTNPKGWDMRTLGELVAENDRINYGIVQPGDHIDGGVPIVRVGDFRSGLVDKSKLKCVSSEIDEKHKKSRLYGDEILIVCVGATIGKVALADPSLEGFNTVRAVTRVRLNSDVNRHYVFRYLQSPFIQQYFSGQLRTVGQPTLNGAQIAETPILIPDDFYQNKYLEIATKIEFWLKKFNCHNEDSSVFFASLSQRAFSGQL